MVSYALAELSIQLYASPEFLREHGPIRSTQALKAHEHAGRVAGIGPRQFVLSKGERREKFRATLPLVGNDIFFLRDVIAAGAGVGPLPTYIARAEVAAGSLVPVLPGYSIRDLTLYFVHPPLNPLPRQIRLLREFITPLAAEVFAAH